MIKKSLLITLLLACLAPWAVNADELTVYENETGTNNFVPIYGTYVDASNFKSEFIIPADQLESMSYGTITKMTFYLSTQASKAWDASFQVYVKEVSDTYVPTSFIGTTDATMVFSGVLNGNSSTMEIPFSASSYTYEGGNLFIGFYITEKGAYANAAFYGKSSVGTSQNPPARVAYNTTTDYFSPARPPNRSTSST